MDIKYARDIASKFGSNKLVLTAGRRTDLIAFHLDHLRHGFENGCFEIRAPMNKPYQLRISPDEINSVGLWSQNFNQLINQPDLKNFGYKFWVRFSINPQSIFKPDSIPDVDQQIDQLEPLVKYLSSPEMVFVYVDPIILFKVENQEWQCNCNESFFEKLVNACSSLAINSISTSFVDYYKYSDKFLQKMFLEIDYNPCSYKKIFDQFNQICVSKNIQLKTCAEGLGAPGASCVNGVVLNQLFGPGASTMPHKLRPLCCCTKSLDISWTTMKCDHRCPLCYYGHGCR